MLTIIHIIGRAKLKGFSCTFAKVPLNNHVRLVEGLNIMTFYTF